MLPRYRGVSTPPVVRMNRDCSLTFHTLPGKGLIPHASLVKLATRELSLDDFEYHESAVPETPAYYTHPCRCSHELLITEDDLESGHDLIDCVGCGERVGVRYERAGEEGSVG